MGKAIARIFGQVALLVALPSVGLAAVGQPDVRGYIGADNRAPGLEVLTRYIVAHEFDGDTAGTFSSPPAITSVMLIDSSTGDVEVPLETWTVVYSDLTTSWTVTGSVSGTQSATATTNVAYSTDDGFIDFTIAPGTYAEGDTFTFEVVDQFDLRELINRPEYAGAILERSFIDERFSILERDEVAEWNSGFTVLGGSFNRSNSAFVVSDNGYAILYDQYRDTRGLPAVLSENTPFPEVLHADRHNRQIAIAAPFWDDLIPKATSRLHFMQQNLGNIEGNSLVLQWTDLAHRDDPTASYTFQLILPGNGVARFHYLEMVDGAGDFADGSSATVGIQWDLVAQAYGGNLYGFEVDGLLSDGLLVEFGSDGDGDLLPEGIERLWGTAVSSRYSDGGADAVSDGAQIIAGLNPTDPSDNDGDDGLLDSDSDGILDLEEQYFGWNELSDDTDSDGLTDDIELAFNTGISNPDSDQDGIIDGDEDVNGDGTVDPTETDPREWDTDADGVHDGDEVDQSTDPVDPDDSRSPSFGMSEDELVFDTEVYRASISVDSSDNAIFGAFSRENNRNGIADDFILGLVQADGAGGYERTISASFPYPVLGDDQRQGSVLTVPGDGDIDRVFAVTHGSAGRLYLFELDFNQAPLDGSTVTWEDVGVFWTVVDMPVAVQHLEAEVDADGNIHLVYGSNTQADGVPQTSGAFVSNRAERGVQWAKLSPRGELLAGPVQLYSSTPPNHFHTHPRIELDAGDRAHMVFKAGECNWSTGPQNCHLYYASVNADGSPYVATTEIEIGSNGGLHKAPEIAVSPNGNVNLVYAAQSNRMWPDQYICGGYCYGRPLMLTVLSTGGGQVSTLVDRKVLFDEGPVEGRPDHSRISSFRSPAMTTDAAGNLHVLVSEDNSQSYQDGVYAVFSPMGELRGPPLAVFSAHYWPINDIEVQGTTAWMSYAQQSNRDGWVRGFDFSGLVTTDDEQVAPVNVSPALSAISPEAGRLDRRVELTFTGENFTDSAVFAVGGVALEDVTVWSATSATGFLPASALSAGVYDATVTLTDGGVATLSQAYRAGTPDPVIVGVFPNTVPAESRVTVIVTGRNFVASPTVRAGSSAASSVTQLADGGLQVVFNELSAGDYDVTVDNGDGGTATLAGALNAVREEGGNTVNLSGGEGCNQSGGSSMAWLLGLLFVLGFRRVRFAAVGLGLLLLATSAQAAVGETTPFGMSSADNLMPDARVYPRYATEPVFSGTGDGVMTYPLVDEQDSFDHGTGQPLIPLEDWTVSTSDGTTWTVTGSVSGAQSPATTGVGYTTDDGFVSFLINAGTTAFAAGDTFTFSTTDYIDTTALTQNVVSVQVSDESCAYVNRRDIGAVPGIQMPDNMIGQTWFSSDGHGLAACDNGVVQLDTSSGERFTASVGVNTPLPNALISSQAGNHLATLLPFWDALLPKESSRINVAWIGSTGSGRNVVVEYVDFAHEDDPTASYTFEVVISANRHIRYLYGALNDGSGDFADGRSATVAFAPTRERTNRAINYGFETTGLLRPGLAIEFGLDQDSDYLPVGVERIYGTSDTNPTTDGGAVSDGAQILAGLDPTDPGDNAGNEVDTDADGLTDLDEDFLGTSTTDEDSDMDGVNDGVELLNGMDPLNPDSDGDGVTDGDEDADGDGAVDTGETDPLLWDTDFDGIDDGAELDDGSDPTRIDSGRANVFVLDDGDDWKLSSVGIDRNRNIVAFSKNDDGPIYVAAFIPSGERYQMVLAPTEFEVAQNDMGAVATATVPGDRLFDRVFAFTHSQDNGIPALYEFDFNRAPLDGAPFRSEETDRYGDIEDLIVRQIGLPIGLNTHHPYMAVGPDGMLHLTYIASDGIGEQFSGQNVGNEQGGRQLGVYWLRVDPDSGRTLNGPVEIYRKDGIANHGHINPQLDFDPEGDVHVLFRHGICNWERGSGGCSMYYAELAPTGGIIRPVTRLGLSPRGGIDKAPSIAVGDQGRVYITYASTQPRITDDTGGGYNFGRSVYVHAFDIVGGEMMTVWDQMEVLSASRASENHSTAFGSCVVSRDGTAGCDRTDRFFPSSDQVEPPVWSTPQLTIDDGGNLHLASSDWENNEGVYLILDSDGNELVRRILPDYEYGQNPPSIVTRGTMSALFAPGNEGLLYISDNAGFVDPNAPSTPAGEVSVASISPSSANAGATVEVTILGRNFATGATVTVGSTSLQNTTVWSDTRITGVLDLTGVGDAVYDLTVTIGGSSVVLEDAFRVGDAPVTVSQVVPSNVQAGEESVVLVLGSGFDPNARVDLNDIRAPAAVRYDGAIEVTVGADAPAGTYDVIVTNEDGGTATLSAGLSVGTVTPTIATVTPAEVTADSATLVRIYGAGFSDGATVMVSGTMVSDVSRASSNQLEALLPGLSAGTYDVTVTNPNGETVTANGAIEVVSGVPQVILEDGGCAATAMPAWLGLFGLLGFIRRRRRS